MTSKTDKGGGGPAVSEIIGKLIMPEEVSPLTLQPVEICFCFTYRETTFKSRLLPKKIFPEPLGLPTLNTYAPK